MRLGRRIAALEAKLRAIAVRCRTLKLSARRTIDELRDCHMVKAELKRLLDELYKKKKDRGTT